MWKVLDTKVASAEDNMRKDAELLDGCGESSSAILHLYDWRGDCATYGYLVDPYTLLSADGVKKRSLSIARRPTGGGVIFHMWDLAFSVIVPASSTLFSENTLQNYALINTAVLRACEEFIDSCGIMQMIPDDKIALDGSCKRFCMAQPTKYDVVMHGKKVAGAAQRKTVKGFLHQGSISLMLPSYEYLQDVLLAGTKVAEAMFASTYPLLGPSAQEQDLPAARSLLKKLLIQQITKEG